MSRSVLSVVVATLNCSESVRALLESVRRAREYGRQHELGLQLVVQDGGSSDDTIDIVRSFLEPGDGFKVESDNGIYDALNRAIGGATGEWIMFVGGDDVLLCTDICVRLDALRQSSTQLVVGESVKADGTRMLNKWGWRLVFGHSVNHQACIYRRRMFDDVRYPTIYRLGADYWLNLTFYVRGTKVARWNGVILVRYSDTGVSSKNVALGRREAYQVRRDVLGMKGIVLNGLVSAKHLLRGGRSL